MLEDIAHVGPMLIVAGPLTRWIAEAVSREAMAIVAQRSLWRSLRPRT